MMLASTTLLATDEQLKRIDLHPGDRLASLGFPMGAEGNDAGFPVLRSGYVASYPLTPTKSTKTLLFDFSVFQETAEGLSISRSWGAAVENRIRLDQSVRLLIGLVSRQSLIQEDVAGLTERRQLSHPLALATVVHASLILETLALLPPAPKE